jgi:hypothetical protein
MIDNVTHLVDWQVRREIESQVPAAIESRVCRGSEADERLRTRPQGFPVSASFNHCSATIRYLVLTPGSLAALASRKHAFAFRRNSARRTMPT